MTGRPDLVVHVAVGAGGALLTSALPLLAPELQRQGVRVSGPDAVPHVGGAPVLVASAGRPVGPDPSDAWAFCSLSAEDVAQVVAESGARRARVVFCPQRQDRMLERAYRLAVEDGFAGTLAELFPRRFEPVYDFAPIVPALRELPGVSDVHVLPEELVAAGPVAFVGALLGELGCPRPVGLTALNRWRLPREYAPRGVRIAAAMAAHLDSDEERGWVRGYVLDNFSVTAGATPAVLTSERRARVLAAYREPNRAFFTGFAPEYPASSYSGRAGLDALGTVLTPIGLPGPRREAGGLVRDVARRARRRVTRP